LERPPKEILASVKVKARRFDLSRKEQERRERDRIRLRKQGDEREKEEETSKNSARKLPLVVNRYAVMPLILTVRMHIFILLPFNIQPGRQHHSIQKSLLLSVSDMVQKANSKLVDKST
jgi:hypothetical protein